jgi:hypothetical protein
MTPEQIYVFMQQQPFPMRVHLRDGRTVDIATREFVVVGVTFLDVGAQLPHAPEGIWGPGTRLLLKDVTRIESLKSPAALQV